MAGRMVRRAGVSLIFALSAPVAFAAPPLPKAAPTPIADSVVAPAMRDHVVKTDRGDVAYRARWAETVLKDAEGVAAATISATSYVRADVANKAGRPVVFLFNGGPGASSSPLHFSALGPRIRKGDATIDNASSLIGDADLVFIDPVGTGFSRELKEGAGKHFWSVASDADSVLLFIKRWLAENNREESPVFIAGESYGGLRLAEMAKGLSDVNVAGLIFISSLTDMSASAGAAGNDQPYVFSLPSMAVAAWAHGKAEKASGAVSAVWEKARRFAQSEYVAALQLGAALPAASRARVARKMASMIGLPAKQIEKDDLRVGTQEFLESLLEDENKIVGRLDTRVTALKRKEPLNPDRPAAANDPALGLGASNVIKSPWAEKYFRDELGVRTDRQYYALTLDVNFNWSWRDEDAEFDASAYRNATPNIAALMKQKPAMRVLLLSGYYDLATPMLGQRYALTHGGLPLDRVTMVGFDAGHSPYDDDKNRKLFSHAIRDFIDASLRAQKEGR